MRTEPRLLISQSGSPYENLAIEKYVTEHVRRGERVLFLWQNSDTIVIGRNQNCWRECRVSEFLESGGRIARRLSGGGAVYHDGGNLNFSFIAPDDEWTASDGIEVMAAACASFGINATPSGRNDLLANGAKFSGNAFYSTASEDGITGYCHHGCILIAADTERMSRFLNVSKEKLRSKGVASVRSRVVNLASISEGLTSELFGAALVGAFESKCGGPADEYIISAEARKEIEASARYLSSDEWIFGRKIDFTDSFGGRFPWGEIELCFKVSAGKICQCRIYSDCMDASLTDALENALCGLHFSADEMIRSLHPVLLQGESSPRTFAPDISDVKKDIASLLIKNI